MRLWQPSGPSRTAVEGTWNGPFHFWVFESSWEVAGFPQITGLKSLSWDERDAGAKSLRLRIHIPINRKPVLLQLAPLANPLRDLISSQATQSMNPLRNDLWRLWLSMAPASQIWSLKDSRSPPPQSDVWEANALCHICFPNLLRVCLWLKGHSLACLKHFDAWGRTPNWWQAESMKFWKQLSWYYILHKRDMKTLSGSQAFMHPSSFTFLNKDGGKFEASI